MKILYYTQNYFLDSDLPLIKELRAQGHIVYLFFEITSYSLKSPLFNISKQINKTGLLSLNTYKEFQPYNQYVDMDRSYILNRPGKIFGFSNLFLRLAFAKKIKELSPDIIFSTEFIDIPDRFLYHYKEKIVQLVHDPFPHIGENTYRKQINRQYAFQRIKKFVLLNHSQVEPFSKTFNIPLENIIENYLGTYDLIKLYNSPNKKSPSTKKNTILFWGRISPYKGIEFLLDAMKSVHQECPSANLIVAGAGDYYFDLDKFKNCSYIHFIHKHLEMNELHELLKQSKFVVCPYIEATQSGVIMTAFAMDVPVIVTNVGGLPEMTDYGKMGLIVPPKDSIALGEAISKLYSTDQLHHELTASIQSMKKTGKRSWHNIAKKYISVFESLK